MKFAFSTQSYKGDFRECKLLCESLDRFAPGIEHFIFVNDEDYLLFRSLNYSQHKVHKKSECTPWYFFRFPFKILDHFFWVSPFTFPMRGWIYQQICKLAIFDVIGDSYDFIINMDSEVIMIKPFDLNSVYKGGKFKLYRNIATGADPYRGKYIRSIQKFFKGSFPQEEMYKYGYMDITTIFVRENIQDMLSEIQKNSPYWNWRLWMANTIKFSEFYTYGNYVVYGLNLRNHYLTENLDVQLIEYETHIDKNSMDMLMEKIENDPSKTYLWVQKIRHVKNNTDDFFSEIEDYFHKRWNIK